MQQRELTIELRNKTGKGIARRLRQQGKVPGVVYGKGIEPVAVATTAKELAAAIGGEGGHNNLITLKGALEGTVVIVSELSRGALKRNLEHVDFHKISLTDKVHVTVKLNVLGSSKGVRDGGLLDHAMHELKVECLPTQIPEHIDVDVTELAIGHSIHVSELAVPAGVKVLENPKATVVSVLGRAKEEAAAEAAAE